MCQEVTGRQVPGAAAGAAQTTSSTMASQSQGVQQLLAAEKKAAEKVAEARKREYRARDACSVEWRGFSAGRPARVAGNVGVLAPPPPPDPARQEAGQGRSIVPPGACRASPGPWGYGTLGPGKAACLLC